MWTIYTWLWTVLLPFKNIAWRVALAEATSGALAAGLLGLIVSRGSSMLIEGIEELKGMAGRWENAICVISGFVAGQLIGYNGYMWSQSVIVEVYSFSVCSFSFVLVFLMRWIHAPHQYRYLYLAMFMFGITFTNHQSLIVAAMGIEVAIIAAHPRLGRDFALIYTLIYVVALFLKASGKLPQFSSPPGRVFLGLVLGVAFGVFLSRSMDQPAAEALLGELRIVGDIFIAAVRLIIIPLIFMTLVAGVLALRDPARLGTIGMKTIALYLATTLVANGIGLGMGPVFRPGDGVDWTNTVLLVTADHAAPGGCP